MFQKTLFRTPDIRLDGPVLVRRAARGVCLRDGKILVVYSKTYNHFEIPGGGLKENETPELAVARELLEETGYSLTSIDRLLGDVLEYDVARTPGFSVYQVTNTYFLVTVSHRRVAQHLEANELPYDYEPVWCDPHRVLLSYQDMIGTGRIGGNEWVYREKYVLETVFLI